METILLVWNPALFPWEDLQDELSEIKRIGKVTEKWSVGNRTTLETGSRFFLVRLGVEPRGLVGSGWITSSPFDAPHWNPDKAAQGKTARYADLYFDVLQDKPIIAMEQLQQPPFSDAHWSPQTAGIEIPEAIAEHLELLWSKLTSSVDPGGREELISPNVTIANHSTRVHVNRYERSPQARALCLAHHGLRCQCCDTLLEDIYGNAARELIHVHHLTPLSSIPEGAIIDPINDLRPVCPNCHSVIHTKVPPYSIDEVREMIDRAGQGC